VKVNAQTLEWINVFDVHSIGFGAGAVRPSSQIDTNGKITTVVVENDTLKLYQTLGSGVIVNSFSSNKMVNNNSTPLIKTTNNELSLVYKSGSFWLLQTDADLNVTRNTSLTLPSGITSSSTVHHLIEYDDELYLTVMGNGNHYLLKINNNNTLSVVYNSSLSGGYGEDYILLDSGNIIFSYRNANNHIIRCVSIDNGILVWEQTINRNHGILLKYRIAKNGNVLYAAGLERAWVGGVADDELAISHIDINSGNILFQEPLALPYCSGCFIGFENFVYNTSNDKLYITYVSGFPTPAVSIVELNNISENVLQQTYFPISYDAILPQIDDYSRIYVKPNGQVVLLYKSYKNLTEKTNLYISPLDATLLSTDTLEINVGTLESVEHPSDVRIYDNSRILITGIIPNANPSIFWEQVNFFTTMVNLDDALSVTNPEENKVAITIYPNPANEIITIITPENVKELTVYSVLGKVMDKQKITQKEFTMNVSSYPAGIYFLTFSGSQNIVKKLIVR